MKLKRLILPLFAGMILFQACNENIDNEEIPQYSNIQQINENITNLAYLIAKASGKSIELRKLIKAEVGKQFDYDNDALLITFLEKKIGNENFAYLLAQQSDGKFSSDDIVNMIKNSGYLQLSIPIGFDEFNPESDSPQTVVIPHGTTEQNATNFVSFDKHGNKGEIEAKTRPGSPLFVIMEAERVDKFGKVVVDLNDTYVEPENRIHFSDAVKQADERRMLKSTNCNESLLKVISNDEYKKLKINKTNSTDILNNNNLKSSMAISVNEIEFRANASYENTSLLQWNPKAGANRFKIFRSGKVNGQQQETQIYDLTNTYSITNTLQYSNEEYIYYLKYYNNNTFLSQTNLCLIHSSHRKNNGMEYVDRIVASEQMVTTLEGWWVSELELRFQIVYTNALNEKVTLPPIGFDVPTNKPSIYRLQEVDWYGDKNLFRWDRSGTGYGSYTVAMEEVDVNDDGPDVIDIALGWVEFLPIDNIYKEIANQLNTTLNILDEPDYIGACIVKWWDPNNDFREINPEGFSIIINQNPN